MSHQGNVWDREYRNHKFVTGKDGPQADTLRFLRFLRKEKKINIENKKILDLGCGTGRNANYLAEVGNEVIAMEVSKEALRIAEEQARKLKINVDYRLNDIGEKYNIPTNSIDIVLDVTSSNSLDEKSRGVYLEEVSRVLKSNGYFFVRALCKDGNKNVKNLLKSSPGKEHDTYIIKEIGLTERVFSREDFVNMYNKYFKILHLEKKTNYTKFNNRIYKRDYWIAYLQKSKTE